MSFVMQRSLMAIGGLVLVLVSVLVAVTIALDLPPTLPALVATATSQTRCSPHIRA